jgi:hypothetical protein
MARDDTSMEPAERVDHRCAPITNRPGQYRKAVGHVADFGGEGRQRANVRPNAARKLTKPGIRRLILAAAAVPASRRAGIAAAAS